MSKDYLVIHDNSKPYDEHTKWKVVPKCDGPVDALGRSGFKASRTHPEDDMVTIFALDSQNEQLQVVGTLEPGEVTPHWKEVIKK